MNKYIVSGMVGGNVTREILASSPEEAAAKFEEEVGHNVDLCHVCGEQVSLSDIYGVEVILDDEVVHTSNLY